MSGGREMSIIVTDEGGTKPKSVPVETLAVGSGVCARHLRSDFIVTELEEPARIVPRQSSSSSFLK